MSGIILRCGKLFDGLSATLSGPVEVLIEGNPIASMGRSVGRPPGVNVIDLPDRIASPGFINTHVYLTMDAANLARQMLESSAAKALEGLGLARIYMSYGSTTLRDLGSADPEWPTIDLRNAINAGVVQSTHLRRRSHYYRRCWSRRLARLLQPALDTARFDDRR